MFAYSSHVLRRLLVYTDQCSPINTCAHSAIFVYRPMFTYSTLFLTRLSVVADQCLNSQLCIEAIIHAYRPMFAYSTHVLRRLSVYTDQCLPIQLLIWAIVRVYKQSTPNQISCKGNCPWIQTNVRLPTLVLQRFSVSTDQCSPTNYCFVAIVSLYRPKLA
jgi:hypothetical protein